MPEEGRRLLSRGGVWSVEALAIGGELVPPLVGTRPTLTIEGDRVVGHGGVNSFEGYLNDSPPPVFTRLASTHMAGPHEHMAQEDVLLRHIGAAESLEVHETEMHLVSKDLVVVALRRPGTDEQSKTSNT